MNSVNPILNIKYKDFETVCRVCLANGQLEQILKTDVANIFHRISQIELCEDNRLPKNICAPCLDYLRNVVKFAEICKKNDTLLKGILQNEDNKLKNDIELEIRFQENIADNQNLKLENDDSSDNASEFERLRKRTKKSLRNNGNGTEASCKEEVIRNGKKSAPVMRSVQKSKMKKNNENEKSGSAAPICNVCRTKFTSKTKLCLHYKENENCRPENFKLFKCDVCKKDFSTVRRRNEHMNYHTGETPYVCSYCGKRFQLYPAHFKHVYRHKLSLGEVELKPGYTETRVRLNLKCDACPKIFASRSGFANHQLIHQGIKVQYKKRMTKKEGPKLKKFLCNYCAKSFVTKVQLDGHIRGHTGERPFGCRICYKMFKTRAALKTHEMSHLGTTPQRFTCDICNKPFSLKAHYEVHRRTHTGEKPFECHFCRKCFNYRGTWRYSEDSESLFEKNLFLFHHRFKVLSPHNQDSGMLQ